MSSSPEVDAPDGVVLSEAYTPRLLGPKLGGHHSFFYKYGREFLREIQHDVVAAWHRSCLPPFYLRFLVERRKRRTRGIAGSEDERDVCGDGVHEGLLVSLRALQN